MSLTNFLKRVMDSSLPAPTVAYSFFSDKTGGSNDYYHYEPYKKSKSKSKSEKKHAILSALTLLAFLFFLNILQNCIREQNQIRGSIMIFGASAPQAKYQVNDSTLKESIRARKKRSSFNYEIKQLLQENKKTSKSETSETIRRSRNLLEFSEQKNSTISNRPLKFIHNFKKITNWTNALSQISDKDLYEQKLKTLNLNTFWKSKILPFLNKTNFPVSITAMNLFHSKSKHFNNRFPFLKKKMKNRKGTSTVSHKLKSANKVFNEHNASKINKENSNSSVYNNFKNSKRLPSFDQQLDTSVPAAETKMKMKRRHVNESTSNQIVEESKRTYKVDRQHLGIDNSEMNSSFSTTTPKNTRSDFSNTLQSSDYKDFFQPPTPTQALGLDLNTFQTYPIHDYYNYRFGGNEMTELVTSQTPTKHDVLEFDRMHTSTDVQNSLFYPTKIPPQHFKSSQIKTGNSLGRLDYPSIKSPYQYFPASLFRYRYSPYRKAGSYEFSNFRDSPHEDYIVVARYPQDEGSTFDFSKLLWTVFTSLTEPLTNLIPGLAKDNDDNPQCYDLMVCEAQRVSKFMGPTAEALTTTLGTLLSWTVAEETRQMVIEALNSGRENTCQQQIKDCEDRYGGKSAMTVIAQVMEIKLR